MPKLRLLVCEIGLVSLLGGGPAAAAAAAPQETAESGDPAAATRAADAHAATDPPAAQGETGRGAATAGAATAGAATEPASAATEPAGAATEPASAATEPASAATEPQTGPISGYMDFHINDAQHADPVLDFHRFVLLVSHRFSDRVHFVSEIELEHAVVSPETEGEFELEQAYVDFRIARAFNLRAGMVLAPVGIINERHEPPVFHGVERPLVETVLIPTTWFGAGAGIHGELRGGFRYRAYAMETLDASRFSAEGLREGRQKGAESNARHVAGTGRIEYVGTPGLTLGASLWTGRTGFATPRVDSGLTLAEFDGRYRVGEVGLRGLYAHAFLTGTDDLNRSVQRTTGINPNIAREMRGLYLEGSWFVVPRPAPREVAVFVRYENLDTQFRMAPGYGPLRAFDRAAWIAGVTYFPDPDVAVKVDYTVVRSRSAVIDAPNSLNVGLGWWF